MNLLLEGDDLEALLLRASREGGTSARIVRAEKVRRGGVLGFFTKEGFEVAVEIPRSNDKPPEGKPAARKPTAARKSPARKSGGQTSGRRPGPKSAKGAPADSLLELAERTSAAERAAALAVAREAAFQAAMRDVAVFLPERDETEVEVEAQAEVEADVEAEGAADIEAEGAADVEAQIDLDFEAETEQDAEADDEDLDDEDLDDEDETLPAQPAATVVAVYTENDTEPPTAPSDLPAVAAAKPAPGRFARISFAKAEFPEERPWPGLAGLSPLLSPAWLKRPSRLNEPDPMADQPMVTDVPEVSEPAVADQPMVDVFDDVAQLAASDAEMWFNTSPAVESGGQGFESPQIFDDPAIFDEPGIFDEPEISAEPQHFDEPPHLDEPQHIDEPQTIDAAEQIRPDYPVDDDFELSVTGAGGHHLTEIGPLAGTGLPRAATVVPRHRSRRGGVSRVNRSLPIPRASSVDESDEKPEQHLDQQAVRAETDDDTVMSDSTDDYYSNQDADDANELGPTRSDRPAGLRTSSEAAWRLLRSWRPGVRRRQAQDDDPGHLREAEQWAPEDIELALDPMTASLAFAEAAIHGTVPATAALIESVDQLAADRAALAALGIPAAWTDDLTEGDRFTSIVTMLSRLVEPSIQDDAAVIAVVGPADVVELEAHRTALDLPARGRPRAVTLVSGQIGVDRRAAIARSKRIRPVVISIPIEGYDDPAGTRQILDSVKADAVIAVVDASRPLAEITRWIKALERVDAIALDGALDADRPASVLGLDVPVIRVDGISVDRIGWAALLCAQLAAMESAR